MYKEAAINCFRFLGFTSFADVDRLTIPEYLLLMEAAKLRQIDADYRNHLQAWLNFTVKARRGKQQRPVFTKFEKFYDYKKQLAKAKQKQKTDGESKYAGIGKFLKKGE